MPERARSIPVEAVVLRHQDWGEADRMLTIFSLQQGKQRVLAKGARRVRSRKAGHLEPFMRARLLLARGRDLLLVTQAEAIETYPHLRGELLGIGYASYVLEMIDRFTYEEGENATLYSLLHETLARLEAGDDAQRALALRYFDVHLLDLVGYRPQLFTCANCNQTIQAEDQYFSAELGGVLCPRCGFNRPGVRPVSLDALRYLRHLQRSGYREAQRATPGEEHFHEMEGLLQYYITYLLERKLNTPGFIRRVLPVRDAEPFSPPPRLD